MSTALMVSGAWLFAAGLLAWLWHRAHDNREASDLFEGASVAEQPDLHLIDGPGGEVLSLEGYRAVRRDPDHPTVRDHREGA